MYVCVREGWRERGGEGEGEGDGDGEGEGWSEGERERVVVCGRADVGYQRLT